MYTQLNSKQADKKFRILSLCGGGLNGAIAAGILKTVEETLRVKTAGLYERKRNGYIRSILQGEFVLLDDDANSRT